MTERPPLRVDVFNSANYWVGRNFGIRAEEHALERVFGEEYLRYRVAEPRCSRRSRFR